MAKKLFQSGNSAGIVVFKYRNKRKKKKRSKRLKGIEREVNRVSKAGEAFFTKYRKRHNRSTRKKKNGWLRKLDVNLFKAANAGRKKLKLKRLFRI